MASEPLILGREEYAAVKLILERLGGTLLGVEVKGSAPGSAPIVVPAQLPAGPAAHTGAEAAGHHAAGS